MTAPSAPVHRTPRIVRVDVELRPERGKLYAHATFHTDDGPLVVDHLFVKARHGDRPRVEMPGRPAGQVWISVVRIPDVWYSALIAAVERALAS